MNEEQLRKQTAHVLSVAEGNLSVVIDQLRTLHGVDLDTVLKELTEAHEAVTEKRKEYQS